MEKDDKIQKRQAQTSKLGGIAAFVLLGLMWGVHVVYNTDSFKHPDHIAAAKEHALQYHRVDRVEEKYEAHDHELQAAQEGPEMSELLAQYAALDEQVRGLKARVKIMETDPECQRVTKQLQDVARKCIVARYGDPPYVVRVELEFPKTMPDYAERGSDGFIEIELAPIELIPVSVWTFLEVSRTFKNGAFHRNAGHVLQVQVQSNEIKKHLPFQEYSKDFPHKKGTVGYCGRPSGPCWYVSLINNSVNHVSENDGGKSWELLIFVCFCISPTTTLLIAAGPGQSTTRKSL